MPDNFTHIAIGERSYRYSDERRISGRPAIIQFFHAGDWRDVRNIDRSDQIWDIADGRCSA